MLGGFDDTWVQGHARLFLFAWLSAIWRNVCALAVQTVCRAQRRKGETPVALHLTIQPVARMVFLAAVSDASVIRWYFHKDDDRITNNVDVGALASLGYWWALLVLKAFTWEVVFDLAHYWMHRLSHANTALYRLSHRVHHRGYQPNKSRAPTPLATFQQGAIDLVLSNAIPAALALVAVDRTLGCMSPLAIEPLFAQKVFVEVAGHNGLSETTWTAFPLCVWLPRALGIAIRSRDHHAHHVHPSCNFGKRTMLWDKVFGTQLKTTTTQMAM